MCVVLRFVVFVARYLNYIEYRCCISDTLRSIQFYFIVEEGCTKLVSFRLFGSNGGPLFFRRAREEIEIFEVIKIGRKTWKNWEKTGQNWAKLGKTGENRGELGKTGRNWAELNEIGRKIQQNRSKLGKTAQNWVKLGKTA